MLDAVRTLVAAARDVMSSLEPQQLAGAEAVELVDLCGELERLAVAGRTLAGRRVEQTKAWFGSAYSSPAKWMAAHARTTLGSAIATLETGRRLDELPSTRDAFVSGALSGQQAHDITTAASADPAAEPALLDAASKDTVDSLRRQCREVVAAASSDLDEDQRRHRSRYLRLWPADGMIRVEGRLTVDAGAKLSAVLLVRAQDLAAKALAAGVRERREAYTADALVGLVDEAIPGAKAVVNVLVDYAALKRGHLQPGERSSIPGIGPVSIPAVKRLIEQGVVKAILTDGFDVRAAANLGRTIPANLGPPLEARDPVCVVPGCDESEDLQVHYRTDLGARGQRTRLADLCRVCSGHALLIRQRGYRVGGEPGAWQWLPPEHTGLPPPNEN